MSDKKAVKTLRSLADLGSPEVASDVAEVVKKPKRKPFVIAKRDRSQAPDLKVVEKRPSEIGIDLHEEHQLNEMKKAVKAGKDPLGEAPQLSFAERMKAARAAKAAKQVADSNWPDKIDDKVKLTGTEKVLLGSVKKTTLGEANKAKPVDDADKMMQEFEKGIPAIAKLAEKMSDMGVSIASVGDIEVVVKTEEEIARRENVINALLDFNSKHYESDLKAVYATIATERLEEMLNLLNAEWGGSPKAKASIEAAQKLFKESVSHRLTKARKSILTTKYKEYHLLAQKVEKVLGTDTVVHTLKLTDYHKALQQMIEHHSALSQGVREMANMIAFDVSESGEDGPDMVPEDTVELLRILLTVGVSAKNWMLSSNEAVKANAKLEERVSQLTKELKAANKMVVDERQRYADREEEIRKATNAKFGAQFALINGSGQFIGLEEDAESINPSVMKFVSNLDQALLFKTEEKMRLLYDRLRRWSKKDSKYFKLTHRRGFTPDNLSTVTVTLTRV